MKRVASNLIAHELIGLRGEVVEGHYKGIEGEIVYETKNTLSFMTERGLKIVPKKPSVFKFDLPEGAVIIKGERILGRPEDRVRRCPRT